MDVKLTAMIVFLSIGIVYFADYLVKFIKKDPRMWRSILISTMFSGMTLLISTLH